MKNALTLCVVALAAMVMTTNTYGKKPADGGAAPAGNDGVQPGTFETVDISVILAHRSALESDEGTRSLHLSGVASATTTGAEITWDDNDEDDDNFIHLTATKGSNSDTPEGYLRLEVGTLNNNRYEGTGVGVFDTDGDGVGPSDADEDDDGNPDSPDADGDGIDDDDQVIVLRYFVGQHSNAHGDFLQGTMHKASDDTATAGPNFNGRIRSTRNGK